MMDEIRDLSSLANGTSIPDFIKDVPGIGWLHRLLSTWLKLDITMIAAALTILGTISGLLGVLQTTAVKLYWYITRWFTASVSINARDKLNREVLNWLGANVLERQGTRILTARSEQIETDAFYYRRSPPSIDRSDFTMDKRKPIQYLPTFGTTWFVHNYNLFIVRRVSASSSGMSFVDNVPDEFAAAPEGTEPLVVMCLGRSAEPIKQFLEACREFADKAREQYVTVRASKSQYGDESWETTILRPIRPLETIHFDEDAKKELVDDIANYLDPVTRRFYTQRGIPYRRGYLLHGPAGTGKTSLSLGLAGFFGLELYLLHVPSVQGDADLERLFTTLPPRCFILLEDIDVVGIKRRPEDHERGEDEDGRGLDDDDESADRSPRYGRSAVTLSGLLNVLDGVASQEGRIVLMTSNFADKLDRALVRPGRIDRMIFLGHISPRSAELMFLRMYERDPSAPDQAQAQAQAQEARQDDGGGDALQGLALRFGGRIQDGTFTPAQLQGYLLNHRNSPRTAADQVDAWAREEMASMEEAKKRARDAAAARQRRREKRKLNVMVNGNVGGGYGQAAGPWGPGHPYGPYGFPGQQQQPLTPVSSGVKGLPIPSRDDEDEETKEAKEEVTLK